MNLFRHANRTRNEDTRRLYAVYELAYTVVDFAAAICFAVGSVLLLWSAFETTATGFFIAGSCFFLAKPTLRLAREVKLWRMGRLDRLAARVASD